MLVCFPGHTLPLRFDQPEINDGFGNRTIWSIARDRNNFIWLATTQNILRYDGYQFEPLDIPEDIRYKKRTVHVDSNNRLWIGTELGELYSYDHKQLNHHGIVSTSKSQKANNNRQINQISSFGDTLYIATQKGLFSKQQGTDEYQQLGDVDQMVKSIWIKDRSTVYLTLKNTLSRFDTVTGTHEPLIEFRNDEYPRLIHPYDKDIIYLGTNQQLHKIDLNTRQTESLPSLPEDVIISMASDERWLWIGTLTQGLFLFDQHTGTMQNFRHHPNTTGALSDHVIVSMLLEPGGALFLGTFDGNLNTTHRQRLLFGTISGTQFTNECIRSNVIYHVLEDEDHSLWLSTANGLVHLKQGSCQYFSAGQGAHSLSYPEIRSISQGHDQVTLWVATNQGLNRLDKNTHQVDRLTGVAPEIPTVITIPRGQDKLLVGTESGLYTYLINQGEFSLMTSPANPLSEASFYAHSYHQADGTDFFATSLGIAQLTNDELVTAEHINHVLSGAEIGDIHVSHADDSMFISTTEHGLYQFDAKTHQLIRQWKPGVELPQPSQLLDILQDNSGDIWVSSRNGLFRFIKENAQVQVFYQDHGLQGNTFKRGSSFKSGDKLFFGGLNGLNAFEPQKIPQPDRNLQVQLTNFRLLNQKNSSNRFTHDINQMDQITLSHRDYIFGFEFSAMEYTAADRVIYAYQLAGLEPEWNTTYAGNRQVSYSNLSPGTYTFKVKAASTPGQWSQSIKKLDLIIKPAPWFSWWAYLIYVITLMALLGAYIHHKLRQQHKRSVQLKQQVMRQTQQISQQKEALQILVHKKNEFFSNVTHEFRTPLTLILGPIERLLKTPGLVSHHSSLDLVKRNAEKLLKLVDQLLMLARLNEHSKATQNKINAATVTQALVGVYKHLAMEKDIDFQVSRIDTGWVEVTDNALEIMLGNLLSNAIKYTQHSGKVELSVTHSGSHMRFCVKDNGPGIARQHQTTVFERFTRIDEAKTIEGVGIGLALAQEVAQANGSHITLSSQPGHGCCFEFSLPVVKGNDPGWDNLQRATDDVQAIANAPSEPLKLKTDLSSEKPSLLIIEDNKDMQTHLISEMSAEYMCETADNGHAGMTSACQLIPDLIICDVMMPKMDGFEVCRTLRNNPLTCHIPLILLTALNEKTYRIKGWREGVDMFLTKPFDADELRLQLRNILNIRKAISLKHQNRFLNQAEPQELPLIDARFVDQFKACLAENYQDYNFSVTRLASELCVSERQLQRKCRALLELSPTELLKEWRLKMAVEQLIDGFQVTQVADQCGFSSTSYFSQTFKAKFGISPKQYQQKFKSN
jgi:signal transduction histidine kinase/DNA-binding response OmpR family regulator/ligand-binding sensor domain-containing protein